jgi:hypothetical protein
LSEQEKSSVSEMIGEFLREAAVLILVFVPIEFYKTKDISLSWFLVIVGFSILMLISGVVLERIRP